MQIIYQGTDITSFVQVRKCMMHDTCGERCDCLEIEFENAGAWFRWQPKQDDTIRVVQGAYDTGTLFLHTVLPEEGRYRILATALPCAAREKRWRSFTGRTVEEIMRESALASGMGYAIFGLDGQKVIPYIQQENETCAAMLFRLLKCEGAELICVNGKYTAIGTAWAQERAPVKTLRLTAEQTGAVYRRTGTKWRTLTVRSPWAEGTAEDADAPESAPGMTMQLPVRSGIQAARWARGILLHHNRACECVTMETAPDEAMTAMIRVNITGGTAADGAWLVEDVRHDLFRGRTSVRLYRCLTGIA